MIYTPESVGTITYGQNVFFVCCQNVETGATGQPSALGVNCSVSLQPCLRNDSTDISFKGTKADYTAPGDTQGTCNAPGQPFPLCCLVGVSTGFLYPNPTLEKPIRVIQNSCSDESDKQDVHLLICRCFDRPWTFLPLAPNWLDAGLQHQHSRSRAACDARGWGGL